MTQICRPCDKSTVPWKECPHCEGTGRVIDRDANVTTMTFENRAKATMRRARNRFERRAAKAQARRS